MAADAPIKVIRLKIRCDDEAQFKRELANRVATRLFVPSEQPLTKDTLLALQLKFNDGQVRVKGTARVVKLVDQPRKGMHVKYVALDSDSIQFPLDFAPFDDSGPHPIDTLQHSTSGEHAMHPEEVHPAADEPPGPTTKQWSGGLRPLDILGNYQLLDRLGSGGMAEVYAARATMGRGVEKMVALKVVLPAFGPGTQFGGLFLNEAKISASLQHPNLIQVFDFGEAQGRPYLAMEYVRGRDLATVLQVMRVRGIKPTTAFCTHVVLEVVKALDYLHQRTDVDGRWMHLVHRDVSPGNILLSENGEVKLVDFGVAAAGGQQQRQLVAGKFSYMPAEQIDAQEPSPSWDLYAAGVVLYEMLTLEPLFEGTTSEARGTATKKERIGPPSEKNALATRGLDSVVLTATNPEVQRRYSRARKMLAALEIETVTLGTSDIGHTVKSLFEVDLENEKKRLDSAVLQARAARPHVGAGSGGPFASLRRALAGSSLSRSLSRRPALARGLAAVLVLSFALGTWGVMGSLSKSRELTAHLDRFDERVATGALSGPGGDTALDHLAGARALAPDDARVRERSESLGKVFQLLADKALARGDDAEAAVHLQALLLADPSPDVEQKLKAAEARVREKNRPKPPEPAPELSP